ncbi:MAG: DUF3180 domain-containing protein [Nocardioides sp.]
MGAGTILPWAIVGLVAGWLAHPVLEKRFGVAPVVGWLPPLLLFFLAILVGVTARATHRAVRGELRRPEPHQLVNRLALARAGIVVGSLVAGAYAGYALSWLGLRAELADQRMVRSLLASLGAASMVVAAVFLQRACRIKSEDDEP